MFFLAFLFLPFQLMAEAVDNRSAVKIPAKFKPQVLADMRKNLEVIQGIVAALAKEDFEVAAKTASILGRMDHTDEVMQRRKFMPEGFRKLGPQMHMGFQALARDARDFEDIQHSLEQLSKIMSTCTACHQSYRLEVTD